MTGFDTNKFFHPTFDENFVVQNDKIFSRLDLG